MRYPVRRSLYILTVLLLILLDQVIKRFVRFFPEGALIGEYPPVFELLHCSNTGAAFSLLSGHPWVILLASILLVGLILVTVNRYIRLSKPGQICLLFLIAGAMGNMIDRLTLGYVTDYIHLLFIDFPVFNLADILITASASAMAVLLVSNGLEEKTNASERAHGSVDRDNLPVG